MKFTDYLNNIIETVTNNEIIRAELNALVETSDGVTVEAGLKLLEPIVERMINSWEIIEEINLKSKNTKSIIAQFHALISVPGIFDYLVKNESLSLTFFEKINRLPKDLDGRNDTFIGFFKPIFVAMWGDASVVVPQALSVARVGWLKNINAFSSLQFLAKNEAEDNLKIIFKANDDAFIQEIFQVNNQLQHHPIFNVLTHSSSVDESIRKGVDFILSRDDFDIDRYLSDASPEFKELCQFKVDTFQFLIELFEAKDLSADIFSLNKGKDKQETLLDPATLISELNTTYKEKFELLSQDKLGDVDHRRMKKLYEKLQQLSPEDSEKLKNPMLLLAILKCARDSYSNRSIVRSIFGGKGNIKRDFLNFIIQDFSRKISGDAVAFDKSNEKISEGVLWSAHIAVVGKEPENIEALDQWLTGVILVGTKTKETLAWLDESYLQHIAKGTVLELKTESTPEIIVTKPSAVESFTTTAPAVTNRRASMRMSLAMEAQAALAVEEPRHVAPDQQDEVAKKSGWGMWVASHPGADSSANSLSSVFSNTNLGSK